ncbi:MAG: photosystem I assembly protein Ycf4 [Cyanobacteriota bacterium]|nr:photosystem I assembly protein Ycf4 [Cyanobacteriota bacterium]
MASPGADSSPDRLEQPVLGSRRLSNILIAAAVSIGGVGFLLTSASSRFGRNLLPIGHPAELVWVPQGLVMGLYGVAAVLLATYLWAVIAIDVGSGENRFDRSTGQALVWRQGFRRRIEVTVPLRDIQAVRLDIRDGLSPRRRIALRIQGRRDLPLTRVGEPMPLADIETAGAKLARFLGVPLEGL